MSWSRIKRGAAAVAAVVALGACGGDDGSEAADSGSEPNAGESAGPTTTEPTTTTTAPLTPQEEVLRDYQAATDAVAAAGNPPDPDHPDLLLYLGDDALARVQDTISQWRSLGVGMVSEIQIDASVVSVAGDTAVVRDCFTDTSHSVDLDSGQESETGSSTHFVEVTLERRNDVWVSVQQERLGDTCA